MYNGIGLTTPRGSGTSGYVVRNLSHLRHHETAVERAAALVIRPPTHREPDAAILEHERKRKVEIKCYELQVELEDKGMDEDAIKQEVDALRDRLLKNLSTLEPSAKELKLTDTHGRAAAKRAEIDKMARALGTRSDYAEGEAFDREKQEELKQQRAIERAERERRREEEREKREKEKEKWEAIKRERERIRRRQEDQARKAAEESRNNNRVRDLPPNVPTGPRRREPSPPRFTSRRSRTRSPPPPPRPSSRRSSLNRYRSPPRPSSRRSSPSRPRSPRDTSRDATRRTRSPPYHRDARSSYSMGRRSRSPNRSRSRNRSAARYDIRRSRSPRRPPPSRQGYVGNGGYRRRLTPIRSLSRERRSITPPPPSRRLSSRSPPHRHISPSPPPRRRDRSTTPPRRPGFGERIVDDRSPVPEDEPSVNGRSRSPSPRSRRRSLSRGSSGSEMSVSGSED